MTGKPRGHLGSQLERKAESILEVETEGDIHNINPKYCRNASTRNVGLPQFTWNDDLRRFVFAGAKSVEAREERKLIDCQDLIDKAQEVREVWKRSKLRTFIEENSSWARSKSYAIINFMIQKELLSEEEDGTLRIL